MNMFSYNHIQNKLFVRKLEMEKWKYNLAWWVLG